MLIRIKNKIIRTLKKELDKLNSIAISYPSSTKVIGSKISNQVTLGNESKVIKSTLFFKGSIGNKAYIEEAVLEGNCEIKENTKLYKCNLVGNIKIDKYSSLWGPNIDIITRKEQEVSIGSFCSIARNVSMQVFNHNYKKITTYFIGQNLFNEKWSNERVSKGNIEIKNDVWIGAHSVILGGLTINNGAIVAANSVVTKDVPAYSIVAGSPAKVITYRFEKEVIDKLEELEWWNWSIEKIEKNKFLFEEELTIDSLNKINN
ncbi:CatB-related O-acetyltransferase [Pseudofulvibacter geojedonensis]|uniref:CatB-related O-acetyltransferase n=1 Tax=Pseudofulvibacter geojedonensis TaxID=1123758 RepID=A0ABW3HZ29_9FLAO